MSLTDIVAQNLLAARSRRKLSQQEVAEKAGLDEGPRPGSPVARSVP